MFENKERKVPYPLHDTLWGHKTFYKMISSANCERNNMSMLIFTSSYILIFLSAIFHIIFNFKNSYSTSFKIIKI